MLYIWYIYIIEFVVLVVNSLFDCIIQSAVVVLLKLDKKA